MADALTPVSSNFLERIPAIRLVVFDFDGVFTDNTVYVSEDGRETVRCWRGDGIGLRKLERLGIEPFILSTEVNPIVTYRSQKLNIPCIQAVADKYEALAAIAAERGLRWNEIAYVGNDVNDLACLNAVGLAIVVQDAHPDVLDAADYRTHALGGYGAVREVCDLFEKTLGAQSQRDGFSV